MNELIGKIIILIGALLCLGGCVGMVRFSDFYMRVSGVIKLVTFGTCIILFGILVYSGFTGMGIRSLLCAVFVWITVPVVIQSIVSIVYREKKGKQDK